MKTIRKGFRAALLMAAAVSMLAFAAGARAQDKKDNDDPHHDDNRWPYATTGKSPVLAVVGDIACQPGAEVSGEAKHEVCTDANPSKGTYTNTSLWQSQEATANQIEKMKPAAVALLGDLQYQVGGYSDFMGSFDLTYGAFKFLHRPSPGNHEFYDEHGQTGVAGYGYFSYYNGFLIDTTNDMSLGTPLTVKISDPCPPNLLWTEPQTPAPLPMPYPASPCGYPGLSTPIAQPVPRADGQAGHFEEPAAVGAVGVGDGWYSYNLGSWHLISLNIECSTQQPDGDGCPALGAEPPVGSWFASELAWLEKDLDENHSACTAAYWHQPTFSAANGISPEGEAAKLFWEKLYEHKADLVLNGHDHLYARYRPLEPDGTPDRERGIREFIVGTGGETLDPIVRTPVTAMLATTASPETNQEDPSGNIAFNQQNLEAYSGDYWGVMALTLDPNGYHWDFESAPLASPTVALNGPTSPAPTANGGYSDKGFGFCHNSPDRDRHDDDHSR